MTTESQERSVSYFQTANVRAGVLSSDFESIFRSLKSLKQKVIIGWSLAPIKYTDLEEKSHINEGFFKVFYKLTV